MCCLDIVGMIVTPCSSHSLRLFMIRRNIAIVREFFMTNCTYTVLIRDLAVQQFAHFCRRSKLSISSWVMRIFDALHTRSYRPWLRNEVPATAGNRSVNRAEFVRAQSHGRSPLVCC